MSLLAPAEPSAPTPSSVPVADVRAQFHASLQHVEDAFAVAVQQAEAKIAAADAKLAAADARFAELSTKHDALAKAHADLEAKFAVLKELRAKLDAL